MSFLDALAARLRSSGESFFALSVLSLVALLVMPLGPALLDVGLAANLALSATILVVTLFSPEALRFASFPTLLLLTTLFRLALNVSSTRLVLGRGEAGRVIEAFGKVVVQGNYVVGAVVFAILTLVQLLVVAKGAERVAEVAARFTLDALPGKQMAIDADLRSGFVDAAEARRRRRALERESQLYGAMDGALKFVKGDALAGIAIVLVNVLGGLAAGALRGMALGEAARRYALLAIGDGLVSQIPALLVAVSAAVAVTRVAGEEEGAGLGGEIGRQLTADPRALAAVAALLAALALAPGLPAAPFLTLAAGAAFGAHRISRSRSLAAAARGASAADPAPGGPAVSVESPGRVALELGGDLLALARADGGESIRFELAALRDALQRDAGVSIPHVAIRSGALPASGWSLLVDELEIAFGRAPGSERLSLAAPADLALVGIRASLDDDGWVIAGCDAGRAAALGPILGPLQRVVVGAGAALRGSAQLLLGIQETQALLDSLEPSAPALVREAVRQLPPQLIAEVLRRLLEEGVSVRPLRTILEAILESGGAARGAPALTEVCRRALRRHIGRRVAPGGTLEALLVDPAAEALLRDALDGEVASIHPDAAVALARSLAGARGRPPVVLAPPDVRRPLRNLLAPRVPGVVVLAYDELPPELQISPVGRLGLDHAA
jgi:type III secretion protein V